MTRTTNTTNDFTFTFTRVSSNKKIGPMPVTITSENSCPNSCPLKKGPDGKGGGCYANVGPLALHWRKTKLSELEVLKQIKSIPRGHIHRWNQCGDLIGYQAGDEKINSKFLAALTQANKGKRGYTYTHKNPFIPENAAAIAAANKGGFTVNLSADNITEADSFVKLGIAPVAVVLPEGKTSNFKTPAGNQVIICPATKADSQMTCLQCGLCARAERKAIVGFPAHGTQKKAASEIANG
jgi:hypothetical protein